MSDDIAPCPFCGIELEEGHGERERYWQHPPTSCYLRNAVVYQNGSTMGEFLHLHNWNRRQMHLPALVRQLLERSLQRGLDEAAAHRLIAGLLERDR